VSSWGGSGKVKTYNFTLILSGDGLLEEEALDALFEAGCDDAMFSERDGQFTAEFDREAASFSDAVLSAVRNVETSGVGARVKRVEPDDLVTAQVIADRLGRSRESVRLLVNGQRGPGGFPSPLAHVDAKSKVWRWSEVSEWFMSRMDDPIRLGGAPQFIAALNAALEARSQMVQLTTIAEGIRERGDGTPLEFTSDSVSALPALVDEAATAVKRELASLR
jgi:hypothetical protein